MIVPYRTYIMQGTLTVADFTLKRSKSLRSVKYVTNLPRKYNKIKFMEIEIIISLH